jgi:general nucleoside transport system permease protein
MNERVAVALLALVTLLALWLAPWATFNRETGSRAAVLLLPNRVIDFTLRTEPISVPGQGAVLFLTLLGLVAVAGGALLRDRPRQVLWLLAGGMLIVTTSWGLARFDEVVQARRVVAFQAALAPVIADPGPNRDAARLQAIAAAAPERTLEASIEAARQAGLVVRRLPYGGSAPGFAPFATLLVGYVALALGLRRWSRVSRLLDALLRAVAVPLVSIALALVAAAVVILLLQPTPTGREFLFTSPLTVIAGRIDVLWHSYYVLFSGSLTTLKGFLDALSFATPLIFTGLAVGFGFRAGLFNIGAPGQMVLGAIGTMLVGLYLPGPTWVVLPAAILAAALFGGFWGAIPGFLKARFGANEVINTILLNFIAASLLLLILSSAPTFAPSALRVMQWGAWVVGGALVIWALPPFRPYLAWSPRLTLALVAVVVLAGAVVVAQPRPGDVPVVWNLPFKAPGSEPRSYELQATARLPRLPALFGIDLRSQPGSNVVPVDVALPLAAGVALLGWLLARGVPPLRRRGGGATLLAGLLAGGMAYALGAALGWRALPLAIPATNLNPSFLLALAAAFGVWVFLFRTRFGYELRAAGLAPKAAEYGGANLAANTVTTMAISGALAGLTATHYVLGGALEEYALRQSIPSSDGFDGIAVALLGGNHPLGIVLAAFLFGVLKNGGSLLNISFSGLTRDVVSMLLALVVLFIAAKGFLPERLTQAHRPVAATDKEGEGSHG